MKVPGWIANTWKYFTSAVGAAAATALVLLMPHKPDEFDRQIVIGLDTTMTIVKGDTMKHATTPGDWEQAWRSKVQYDNGFRLHIWEYKTVDVLTGEVYPEVLLTMAPQIGTQTRWKAYAGRAEYDREKIPELLDALPAEKAKELGWVSIIDTLKYVTAKGEDSLTKIQDAQWVNDTTAKPILKIIAPEDTSKHPPHLGAEEVGTSTVPRNWHLVSYDGAAMYALGDGGIYKMADGENEFVPIKIPPFWHNFVNGGCL